jgi:hypothetical protein
MKRRILPEQYLSKECNSAKSQFKDECTMVRTSWSAHVVQRTPFREVAGAPKPSSNQLFVALALGLSIQ